MSDLKNTNQQKEFWTNRYQESKTGWDFEACHNSIKPRSGNELFGIFVH